MQVYLRTHPIGPTGGDEGWKYFGYTKNDIDKRRYTNTHETSPWARHVQQYGYNYITEVLLETEDQFEATLFCINYSLEHGIWNNPKYANQQMENALPGSVKHKFCSQEFIDNHRKSRSPEAIAKNKETKRRNGTTNPSTPEAIVKRKATMERNGTGIWNNPEIVAKQLATKVKNGTMNVNTPESVAKAKATRIKNGTNGNNHTMVSKAKNLATRERNGTTCKGLVTCRDLRTGKRLRVSKESFDQHNYYVGSTSKKPNY